MFHVRRQVRVVALVLGALGAAAGLEAQTILRVKPGTPAGDNGQSWDTAYDHLQDALAAATPIAGGGTPVQIWVAAGTYTPTQLYVPGDPASAEFRLVDGVKVYGGFSGTEDALNERDPTLNVSIISGERGVSGDPLPGDNIRVLVRATGCGAGTVLDGFTITRAGERAVAFSAGAAIIARCTLLRNYSAFYSEDGDHTVVNCRFLGNGTSDSGVGVYLRNGGSVSITNCEFVGNRTSGWGAALEVYLGNAHLPFARSTVKNCTFFGNTAPGEGSLAVTVAAQLLMSNCVVGDAESFWTDSQGAPHSLLEYTVSWGASNGPGQLDLGASILGPGPLFVRTPDPGSDGQWGTVDDDYGDLRLLSYAACLDVGSDAALPADIADLDNDGNTTESVPLDLHGSVRVRDGDGDNASAVDMGAHEYAGAAFGGTIYVDHDAQPGGTGESWSTAFAELRDAMPLAATIADPNHPVQIWVATGTYKPSPPLNQGGNRSASFQLASNVALYGGFAGNETLLSQRDPNVNVTILSGDLNGDDNPENPFTENDDNSRHVVLAPQGVDGSAILDGFGVVGGNADGPSGLDRLGGGFLSDAASPSIRFCVFERNSAMFGGGCYIDNGSMPRLEGCTFTHNRATGPADNGGGGGGVATGGVSNPRFVRCGFKRNETAGAGGGLLHGSGTLVLANCDFIGNASDAGGGGLYIYSAVGLVRAYNCRFLGNTAALGGGALENNRSDSEFSNSIFIGNVAGNGGAIFSSGDGASFASLSVANCTFTLNSAAGQGGAIFTGNNDQTFLRNSIVWSNTDASGSTGPALVLGSGGNAAHCTIQGGFAGDYNSVANPLLIDPDGADNVAGTADDNGRLNPASNAIDTADIGGLVLDVDDLDQDGNTAERLPVDATGVTSRFLDGDGNGSAIVDRGAYEYDGPAFGGLLHVRHGAPPDGDGLSWATAFAELRNLFPLPGRPMQVWVAAGTYKPSPPLNQGGTRQSCFELASNVAFYGGFVGNETQLSQRDPNANVTILSGDLDGDDLPGAPDYTDNSLHIVNGTGTNSAALIDGFTIRGGNASASDGGGGYFANSGDARIQNCQFTGNRTDGTGGAVFLKATSAATIADCRFLGNTANDGGALYLVHGGESLINCVFAGNTASSRGGAVLAGTLLNRGHSFINCTFWANAASGAGGAAWLTTAGSQGTYHDFRNCIFWDHSAGGSGGNVYAQSGQLIIQSCDVQGGQSAIVASPDGLVWQGNVDAAPLFVDALGADDTAGSLDDNLRLQAYSPLIDAGSNALVLPETATDLAGAPRIVNGDGNGAATVDIGAYEYQGPTFDGVLRVKKGAPSTPDGLSWGTAFAELRDALAVAKIISAAGRGPVQIWVAAPPPGTLFPNDAYRPAPPISQGGSRSASFQLASNVALYGGFAGNETQLAQRDPNTNVTILSGDLNGDDNGALNLIDNSYHVVYASGAQTPTLLDGFTVSGGNASGASPNDYGGGLWAANSALQIRGCRFTSNHAQNAAGASFQGGDQTLERCSFAGNSVDNGSAALACQASANVNARQCDFLNNTAGGSATTSTILNLASTVTLINCRVMNNQVLGTGGLGAMTNSDGATANLVNCILSGNSAGNSPGSVGGMTTWRNSNASLFNCAVLGNTGSEGGLYVSNWNYGQSSLSLVNCLIAGNNGSVGTGGVICEGTATVRNCVVWGNRLGGTGGETAQLAGSGFVLSDTTVEGWSGSLGGVRNNGLDPLFADPDGPDNIPGTADDNYQLTSGSPAVDSGDSSAVPSDTYDIDGDDNTTENLPLDLAGQPRFVDDPLAPNTGPGFPASYVDRGAYEFIADCPTCPGPRRWLRPVSGSFGNPANWTPSVPINTHEALFDHRGNTFSVFFDGNTPANPWNARLNLLNGNVTIDLFNKTYRLSASSQPSIVVGNGVGAAGRLYVRNGTLQGVSAQIGVGDPNAIGEINLDASDGTSQMSLSRNLCVGCDGDGTLRINGGAIVISRDASIGDQVGAFGRALVSGPGSSWSIPFFLIIDNGILDVRDGGQVATGFGTYLFASGSITGNGTILGDVVNFGEIGPGNSPGTLTILGNYEQIGEIPELGPSSGALRLQAAGPDFGQFDQLVVSGQVKLGGGLFVDLIDGYTPEPNQPINLPVISAGQIDPNARFDVAFFPGITGNRFLGLDYSAAARTGDIQIVSLPLPGQIDLNATQQASVAGVPNALQVGDFNNDGLDDLVVSVPGEPNTPGEAIVLITRYQGDAYAPDATAYAVGVEPAAITVGEFNAQAGLDIAIANAGSNSVMVLTNNDDPNGSFTPVAPATTFAVGPQPRAIAHADFNRDGLQDLVVGNTGDGTVQILLGSSGRILFIPGGPPMNAGGAVRSVDPFDPDNDDDPDISTGNTDGKAGIIVNTGPETLSFDPVFTVPIGMGAVQLESRALRGDPNRPDLISVNRTDGTVSVLVNTSPGPNNVSFAPAVNLPAGGDPRALALLDLDDDQDADVVVIAKNESNQRVARVLRNDLNAGQLAFAPATDLPAGPDPVALGVGDLNGDATQDLIALNVPGALLVRDPNDPNQPSGQVFVRLNTPAIVGDLDGDGDVDASDVNLFANLMEGPDRRVPPVQCAQTPFDRADTDNDCDVDLADYAVLQLRTGRR